MPRSDPARWPIGTATSGLREPGPAAFAGCSEAGVTHIELDLFGKGRDPGSVEGRAALAEMAEEVKAARLTLWSVHLPFGGRWDVSAPDADARRWAVDQDLRLLTEAAAWGATVAVVHASAEPIGTDERVDRLSLATESLARLSAEAVAVGMVLAVECLPRTCLGNRASEVLRLVQEVPVLRVCCDVNHVFAETPAAFIRALGGHVATLHVSDNDGVDERHWLPGRGVIDWPQVVAALGEVGYRGPFLFEVIPHEPAELAAAWRRLRPAG